MWWAETARAYLGRKGVLLQRGHGAIQSLAPGPDLIETLRDVRARLRTSDALEVHWGAAYAPLMEVSYPSGMVRWRDQRIFARAICAQQVGLPADALAVEFDARMPCLVAVLLEEHRMALCAFGGRRLRTARPLWAVLAAARHLRRAPAVCLQEPDCVTLVGQDGRRQVRGLSAPVADGEPEHAVQELHRILSVPVQGTARLRLRIDGTGNAARGLPFWQDRWSVT